MDSYEGDWIYVSTVGKLSADLFVKGMSGLTVRSPVLLASVRKLSADNILVRSVEEPTVERKPVDVSNAVKLSDDKE